MTQWWQGISSFEKVFWYFAIPFTLVFTIQLIMTFMGLSDDGNIDDVDDIGFDDGFDSSFHLFTIRNFITFFTVFGWTGITMSNLGISKGITILVSIIAGLIVMGIVAGLFYSITRLTESGNIKIKNAIGATGEVYIPIPENKNGVGKIQISIQGSIREIDAMAKGERLATGTYVKVVEVLNNNIVIVEKLG